MPRSHADAPFLEPPPRALTLRNRAEEPYHRLPDVEREIDDLLHLPMHSALETRIAQRNRVAADFVQEESIAYFLREWQRAEQSVARDWLVGQTLERIDGFIHAHLYGLSDVDEGDAYGDIIERVFAAILDLERARGEYYQVRFWNAVLRRCIDRYDHYHRRADAEQAHRASDPHDRDEEDVEDPVGRIPDATVHVEAEVSSRDEAARVIRHLQDRVTPEQLEAYVLRTVHGWPIEGGPGPTLSERYGKTPRTINNWHRTVERAAASFSGGTA